MARVDDVCEAFFNGTRIGKAGSFPEEKEGYVSAWNQKQEYHIAANSGFINWNGENVISVKVYDGGGAGGIFSAIPYLNMMDLIDAVTINNHSPVKINKPGDAKKNIVIEKLGIDAVMSNNRIKSDLGLNLSCVSSPIVESMLLRDPLQKPFSADC